MRQGSQGVATACRWLGLGHARAQQLVLWGGNLPPDLPAGAWTARLGATRTLLVHGERDPIVPGSVLAANEVVLRGAGVPHESLRHDGGHELDTLLLRRLLTR